MHFANACFGKRVHPEQLLPADTALLARVDEAMQPSAKRANRRLSYPESFYFFQHTNYNTILHVDAFIKISSIIISWKRKLGKII
jgi:hypothetical protein